MTKSERLLIGCGILGCAAVIAFNALRSPSLELPAEETRSQASSESSRTASENQAETISRLTSSLFEDADEPQSGTPR